MPDIELDGLPVASSLTAPDLVHIKQNGVDKQAALSVLITLLGNLAPSILNTIDELAAAIGDDANFAATMATALSLKAPQAELDAHAATAHGTGAMTLIADVVVTSPAATIDFTAIPATYKHLRVVFTGRADTGGLNHGYLWARFNGDTGTNYRPAWIGNYGSAGAAVSNSPSNPNDKMIVGDIVLAAALGGLAAMSDIIVPNYAGTVLGKGLLFTGGGFSDAPSASAGGYCWLSTDSIDRITLLPDSGNFIAGTMASLYGLS